MCKSDTRRVPIRILQMGTLLINLVHTAFYIAIFSSFYASLAILRIEHRSYSISAVVFLLFFLGVLPKPSSDAYVPGPVKGATGAVFFLLTFWGFFGLLF